MIPAESVINGLPHRFELLFSSYCFVWKITSGACCVNTQKLSNSPISVKFGEFFPIRWVGFIRRHDVIDVLDANIVIFEFPVKFLDEPLETVLGLLCLVCLDSHFLLFQVYTFLFALDFFVSGFFE